MIPSQSAFATPSCNNGVMMKAIDHLIKNEEVAMKRYNKGLNHQAIKTILDIPARIIVSVTLKRKKMWHPQKPSPK